MISAELASVKSGIMISSTDAVSCLLLADVGRLPVKRYVKPSLAMVKSCGFALPVYLVALSLLEDPFDGFNLFNRCSFPSIIKTFLRKTRWVLIHLQQNQAMFVETGGSRLLICLLVPDSL